MIKSSASIDADHIITLLNFQQGTLFCINILIPLLYIGSSAELQKDVELFKKYVCQHVTNIEGGHGGQQVYMLSNSTPQLMLEMNSYS